MRQVSLRNLSSIHVDYRFSGLSNKQWWEHLVASRSRGHDFSYIVYYWRTKETKHLLVITKKRKAMDWRCEEEARTLFRFVAIDPSNDKKKKKTFDGRAKARKSTNSKSWRSTLQRDFWDLTVSITLGILNGAVQNLGNQATRAYDDTVFFFSLVAKQNNNESLRFWKTKRWRRLHHEAQLIFANGVVFLIKDR